jgi:hypothetical protein
LELVRHQTLACHKLYGVVATTSGAVSGFFGGTGNATIVIFSLP